MVFFQICLLQSVSTTPYVFCFFLYTYFIFYFIPWIYHITSSYLASAKLSPPSERFFLCPFVCFLPVFQVSLSLCLILLEKLPWTSDKIISFYYLLHSSLNVSLFNTYLTVTNYLCNCMLNIDLNIVRYIQTGPPCIFHYVSLHLAQSLKCVCVCVCVCVCSSVAQLGSTLCGPMDCSPPGSSISRIFQARILEQVAISYSQESFWPRDQTHVSCTGRQILHH